MISTSRLVGPTVILVRRYLFNAIELVSSCLHTHNLEFLLFHQKHRVHSAICLIDARELVRVLHKVLLGILAYLLI